MIIRIIAVDKDPPDPRHDVVVWQVPENSRAHQILVELLEDSAYEFVALEYERRKTRHSQRTKKS